MISKEEINKIEKYLKELHEGSYKRSDPLLGCMIRAQLLFLVLRKEGYDPKIMKYTIKGNEKKNYDDKEKISHASGHKFPSHVVVLLNGFILDANVGRAIPKEEYEKEIISYEPREKLLFVEEEPKIDTELCKQYVKRYKLVSFEGIFT
jgi:hypothetical protein